MINILKTYVACPEEYISFRIGFYIASGIGLVFTVLQFILAKARWLKIPAAVAVLTAALFMGLCGNALNQFFHYDSYVAAFYHIEPGFYVVMVLLTITFILLILGLLIRPKRAAVPAEGTVTAFTEPSGASAEPPVSSVPYREFSESTPDTAFIQGQLTNPVTPLTAPAGGTSDTTKQLMEYKQLLDAGVLTQEEFDAKKKQILGL